MEESKQFSVRWEQHASNLASEAECFFQDEAFLDCTLSAEGHSLQAHKLILSAASPHLSTLLRVSADKHPIIIFQEMRFEILKAIVAFIYNGKVSLPESSFQMFMRAAQSLLIRGLSGSSPEIKKPSRKRTAPLEPPPYSVPSHSPSIPPLPLVPPPSEESLAKLQEISFVKYHPHLGRQGRFVAASPSDKFVVKSWKMTDERNGQWKSSNSSSNAAMLKQQGNYMFKKFRLEKPTLPSEQLLDQSEGPEPIKAEQEDQESEQELIVPKVEVREEDEEEDDEEEEEDTNQQPPDKDSFLQTPEAPEGPVPLLVCKTTLKEENDSKWPSNQDGEQPPWPPQESDSGWYPVTDGMAPDGHELELPCGVCHKKYKSRYALNRHMLYECGKARKSFACDECGKKVTRQDTLQKHKLIHLVQHMKDKVAVDT